MDSKMSSQPWIYWHGTRRKNNIISISHLSFILAKDLAISYTLWIGTKCSKGTILSLTAWTKRFCWPIITACRFLEYPIICNIRVSWSPELGYRWRVGPLFAIIQSNCSCMQSFSSNRMWCYSIRWLCWWPLHPSQSTAKPSRAGLLQSWPYLEVWF